MEIFWKDIRYTFRILRSNPGFTAAAVIALALGIGANTAIFSVVDGVLLRPLPVHDPARVMVVHERFTALGLPSIGVSAPDFADITALHDVFENTAVVSGGDYNLTGSEKPERLEGVTVTAGFFPLLGVKPIVGRWLSPEEDKPGANRSIVLSNGAWKRLFASDPNIAGKKISLNGEAFTVVGVMPESFKLPYLKADLWTPLALKPQQFDPVDERGHQWLFMLARLRRGVTADRAQAALNILARRNAEKYPNNFPAQAGWGISVTPILADVVGSSERILVVLLAAVGFVLLITCANVANLMLARASARYKEIAVRTALGASRMRIVRQLLTECVLLALVGGVLGLLLALWGVDVVRTYGPSNVPRLADVRVDGWVLAFTFAVSIASGILFGLAPAFQSTRGDVHESLKEGGRGGATAGAKRQNLRRLLVVSEVALAMVLLVGAGLMIRSFARLMDVPPGFDPHNVLTMQLTLPDSKYAKNPQITGFYQGLMHKIASLPGVQAAGATTGLPMVQSGQWSGSFTIEGHTVQPGEPAPHADQRIITPDYFRALRIPLMEGRSFSDSDSPNSPKVVIIDDVLAKTFWPKEDPIGRRITQDDPKNQHWATIVGVVGNVKHRALDIAPKGVMYWPHAQSENIHNMMLAVRTSKDPAALSTAVRSEVESIDKDQPVYDVQTMDEYMAESVAPKKFSVLLLALFAAVAAALAAVGIYGVMSYSVTQKTHEIGIRMALGARRADVLGEVIRQGMVLALAGVAAGLIGAAIVTRLMSALLFGVSATDPATFAVVALALATVALVASYIPAWRATRVDPVVALRYE
ncbi:MAG TPA: ABC transporter permease [Bryobacteraceae bacterium]|nr:ABC transporter permease [Bryobacteraceae bacterium]